jgi:renalase
VTSELPVLVVGAGISGLACARVLADADVPVQVLDRGRAVGGRLASRTLGGRRVDTGASYFTVDSDGFRAQADDWLARGVARAWTDTFATAGPDGITGRKPGPMRYAGAAGQRSLAEDLAAGLDVRSGNEVCEVGPGATLDGQPAAAVVLAVPDPQALDLLAADSTERSLLEDREWTPSLALAAGFATRSWPEDFDGAFVAGSPVLRWIADDGRRRGDGAPALVAHSSPDFASQWLDSPPEAADELLDAMRRVLGVDADPQWTYVQRWSLAAPSAGREERYHLGDSGIGLCGDGWGPASKVETAWRSGTELGSALVARLGGR